jgi:AcrR family transcriptional regulator
MLAKGKMTKFLNAAGVVFSRHGYEGTSIRAIAKRSNANLGTLQHYWGSKRALFRDLFERRFRALAQEHLRRLRAVEEATAAGGRPDVEAVLRCLIEPAFCGFRNDPADVLPKGHRGSEHKGLQALFGRALMDPSPHVVAELNRIFEAPVKLFIELMRRACAELAVPELDWRLNCVIGAQVFAHVYESRIGRFIGGEANVEGALAAEWVLHFLMRGIGAPPFSASRDLTAAAPASHLSKG